MQELARFTRFVCPQILFVHRLTKRNRHSRCSVLGDPRFRLAGWNSHWMSCATLKM